MPLCLRQLTRERENKHMCLKNEFCAVSISTGQICSSYLISNKKEITAVVSLSSLHHSLFICYFIGVTVPDYKNLTKETGLSWSVSGSILPRPAIDGFLGVPVALDPN